MPENLTTIMDTLTECVCSALEAINRPACDCGLTIGVPAFGPNGCCECDGTTGGKVATFVERVYPADPYTWEQIAPKFPCSTPNVTAADLSVTVLRCYPALSETGQMPQMDVTTEYAHNLNTDMAAVWTALKCCGEQLIIRDSAVESDPEGGCSGFAIRVSVLVNMNLVGDVS
jgi:hypothetical protein